MSTGKCWDIDTTCHWSRHVADTFCKIKLIIPHKMRVMEIMSEHLNELLTMNNNYDFSSSSRQLEYNVINVYNWNPIVHIDMISTGLS